MSYFSDLGLAKPILKALDEDGYNTPTPIQEQAIPSLMKGRDLCGIAQTGTGKTAAFSLPSLDHFARNVKPRNAKSCRMLILSPTRELAAQIAENVRKYSRYVGLSVQCVFGGVPVNAQKRKLQNGTDVLVATPGRLLDLIDQKALTIKDVEIFVLDEADQMMDMGFIHALKQIDKLLPKKRQTLFFSATMPHAIAELGNRFLTDPLRVEVAPQSTTAERIEQFLTKVDQKEKHALLVHYIQHNDVERALVFTRTKHGADRVVRHLQGSGIEARAIHGNKSQGQRTAALQGFKHGEVKILVATDIAARGIDVPGVSHVFNFEIPNLPEQYVHRIGRTARAGADGIAISFVAPGDERAYMKDIERLTGVRCTPMPLPENFREFVAKMPPPAKKKSDGGGRFAKGGNRGGGRNGGGRGKGGGGRNRSGGGRSGGDKPKDKSGGGNSGGGNPNASRDGGSDGSTSQKSGGQKRDGERSGGRGKRSGGKASAKPSANRPNGARPNGGRPSSKRTGSYRPNDKRG